MMFRKEEKKFNNLSPQAQTMLAATWLIMNGVEVGDPKLFVLAIWASIHNKTKFDPKLFAQQPRYLANDSKEFSYQHRNKRRGF